MDSLTRYDLIVLSTLLGARIDQMLDHLQKPVADTPEARAIYHADLAYLADLHGINAKIECLMQPVTTGHTLGEPQP